MTVTAIYLSEYRRLRRPGVTISRQSAASLPVLTHHGDSGLKIPVVRAQHLIHYIGVRRGAGLPVERELERSGLPVSIEQTPNDHGSLPRALDWVWRSSREVEIMELGVFAGRAASRSALHPAVQGAVIGVPTGHSRIEALSNHVHRANSAVKIDIRREAKRFRQSLKSCAPSQFSGASWITFIEKGAGMPGAALAAFGPASALGCSKHPHW